eukprot:322376-Prymnesium_polylepis.1
MEAAGSPVQAETPPRPFALPRSPFNPAVHTPASTAARGSGKFSSRGGRLGTVSVAVHLALLVLTAALGAAALAWPAAEAPLPHS